MVGKVGRPKNGAKNEAKNEVETHEIMSEKMFSDGKGTQIFVTISRPFISSSEEKGAKPELRVELIFANVGASGKEKFEIPVAALPFLRQSFVGVISRDKNRYLAECDRSSQAVSLCLCIFSHRGKNRWNELMTAGLPANPVSKDPEQQDPCLFLDRVFGEILEEVGDTTVIGSEPRSETTPVGSASLDEINAVVAAAA